jgi:hypothetical protein
MVVGDILRGGGIYELYKNGKILFEILAGLLRIPDVRIQHKGGDYPV